jgi:hypothetical protein
VILSLAVVAAVDIVQWELALPVFMTSPNRPATRPAAQIGRMTRTNCGALYWD